MALAKIENGGKKLLYVELANYLANVRAWFLGFPGTDLAIKLLRDIHRNNWVTNYPTAQAIQPRLTTLTNSLVALVSVVVVFKRG